MTRREFLTKGLKAGCGVSLSTGGYAWCEGRFCRVRRHDIEMAGLPGAFDGLQVLLISDIHHSRIVPMSYIEEVVSLANTLRPDVVALCGDYITAGVKWVDPCIEALGRLNPRLERVAVLGNHDHHLDCARVTSKALRQRQIREVTNTGFWLRRGSARLRIAGVGDYWQDKQDLRAALGETKEEERALLLSHNPDYAEKIRDPRVGLVLSGHTHGGQCCIPFLGAPHLPSRYGQKYRAGLCAAPCTKVFVTCGVGMVGFPFRFGCPPEIALLTLKRQEPA